MVEDVGPDKPTTPTSSEGRQRQQHETGRGGYNGSAIPEILLEGRGRPVELDSSRPARVAIAIDPVALINTECVTVTSAMRKHARWAHSSVAAILGGSSSPLGRSTPSARSTDPAAAVDDALASRWGLRGKRGKSLQDNPLLSAFARLRGDLRGCTDIRTFDIPSLLHPFLQVIRSSSTSAPITSLALVAITKFFAYHLISKDSPRLSLGMQLLSAAITHCRFEASDSSADEIVLLRILKLMEGMLCGPGGDLLSDESVCEMMETGLSMCCQLRLSELLRRSAEISMITMCQTVFERLKHLENEVGGDVAALDEEADAEGRAELKMDAPLNSSNAASSQPQGTPTSTTLGASEKEPDNGSEGRSSRSLELRQSSETEGQLGPPGDAQPTQSPSGASDVTSDTKPYSLPSIRELFRVLVNLLEPHDRQHTDAMRIMALRIIDVALEVAGPSIAKHPSLASLAKDDLCRHLFQLVRSDNMNLLNESLRVAGTLLATCRSVLKLQQELFLSYLVACLHPRVEVPRESGIDPRIYEGVPQAPKLVKQPASSTNSGRSTPVPVKDRQKLGLEGGSRKPDAREAMVESIGALVRMPGFMAELFVNYDCEVDRADLCEDLVGLLSRNAFPDSATWSTTNVPPLCLDALLGYVQFIADRLDDEPATAGYPDRNQLARQRVRKKVIISGAMKFNESPKLGIAYLASQGIIEGPDDVASVARFLKGTTRISKKVLGDFLSKKGNEALLASFMELFDFAGKRVDQALREMLGAFRLPGESPLIERIVDVFSDQYSRSAPADIADKDSIYVLVYAVIMLNTDQHNPNVKTQNRMTYEAFAKNLRGINGGKDFAPEYLLEIYDSIKHNEIILPDEHDNKHAFDYAWKELLLKAETSGDLIVCSTNIYDADMFAATWKPVIATLSYVFMSASEDAVYQRVVAGFDQCARIAATYGLSDVLDHLIYCLSTMSTLAAEALPSTALNTEVVIEKKTVMVSETAVKFGRDYRAQLATVVLFKAIVSGNEGKVKHGWTYIIRIWLNLFVNSLIPATFAESKLVLEMPPIPVHTPTQIINREERNNGSGLFQSFTSYLSSYAADDPPEPSDEEMNDTLCTVECVQACPFEEIFASIMKLPSESLAALVSALLEQLPQHSSTPVVAVVKPEQTITSPVGTNGHRISQSNYDPSIIYILELASVLIVKNEGRVDVVGKDVAEALQDVVRNANKFHPLIVSRAAFYLLNLLSAGHEHSFVRAPVVLHMISGLNPAISQQCAVPILKGLSICLRGARTLRNEIINTPDFWSTIRSLLVSPEAASSVFDLLASIMEDSPSSITADNYEAAILLLNDFATAGSVGAMLQPKNDRNARRAKSSLPLNPQSNELVKRGMQAVAMIFQLSGRVPALIEQSHLERNEAWTTYWSPIFRALSNQCINPCLAIRASAFSSLQRALLSPALASPDHDEWTAIFGEVLFPLILQLLKPEVYHSDPVGMGETRVQAATLLCKIFLHYLVLLSEWDGMLELWLRILEIMDRLMNSGQGNSLEEAVSESLKNILLVMSTGGILVPPPHGDNVAHARLWSETRTRLERFLPSMFADIFPEPVATPVAAAAAAVAAATAVATPVVATPEPMPVPVPGTGGSADDNGK